MAKRSSGGHTAHDREVRHIANRLMREGWKVKADLPNFDKPSGVGKDKKVPDIEATKRGHRRLVEVETPDTINRDKKQQETFRRHAGQKPNTTFQVAVTKE